MPSVLISSDLHIKRLHAERLHIKRLAYSGARTLVLKLSRQEAPTTRNPREGILQEMPKPVSVRLTLIGAAMALALSVSASPALAPQAFAQDAFDLSVPKEGMEAGPAPNMVCAPEPLSGSGQGFLSSREESEDAAIKAWTEKAHAVYPEADWENAGDANLSCAVQGLFSKCFADGIPCKPKGAGEDDGETAAAPKSE